MIACQIKDVKQFMNILLASDTFDKFLLEEGRIDTFHTIEIDGARISEFYEGSNEGSNDDSEVLSPFISWKEIRSVCFDLIKGKRTPVFFQFTLHAATDYTQRLITQHDISIDPSLVKSLLVNIRYERGQLNCITGTSFTTFVPDKSLESLWDSTFRKSLDSLHIKFEEL